MSYTSQLPARMSLLRLDLMWCRWLRLHGPKWTWAVGRNGSLHCLTLAVKSLSYAWATLRGRSCPTLCHQVRKGRSTSAEIQLTAASNEKVPMSMFVELDLDFLGIMVPKVGILITQEPYELLDECHKAKLPGIIGWNVIKLAYQVFIQKYQLLGHQQQSETPTLFHQWRWACRQGLDRQYQPAYMCAW